jgi:hypothetical protein
VQEGSPVLSSGVLGANVPHMLLDGPFTYSDIELEHFAANTLGSEDADSAPPSF